MAELGTARGAHPVADGQDHVEVVEQVAAAYLALAVPRALVSGNTEFVIYIGVVVVLVAVIGCVHMKVGLSSGVLWAMSFWG